MVAGLKEPNLVADVMAKLRSDADVSSYIGLGTTARIHTAFPSGDEQWTMPDYAILVRRAGGPRPIMTIGRHFTRIDVRCYAPGKTLNIQRRLADELWRTVNPVLCPPPGRGIAAGWRATDMIVETVDQESEPIPMIEPVANWALVLCSYTVTWRLYP